MTNPITTRASTSSTARIVRPSRLAAAAASVLLFNLVAFGAGSLAGASWQVGQPYAISLFAVAAATLAPFVVGGLVVSLFSRRRAGFRRFAAWAGLIFGVLSMVSLTNAGDLATALSLGSMHVATATAWFVALAGKPRR